MTYISVVDFFLVPLYLIIIYYIAFKIRNNYYPEGHKLRVYFISGLTVKIVGAILICLVYIYYFGAGDTIGYFKTSTIINSSFSESPLTWLRLITHTANEDNITDGYYISLIDNYKTLSNYIVSAVGAIIGIICFTRFLCIAIIIATLAYTGFWALFKTFTQLYPTLIKQSALAALFLPGVAMWGSGLFKDTICMFALGWLIFSFFNLLKPNDSKLKGIIIFSIMCVILYSVKPYILAVIFPLLVLRLIIQLTISTKNTFYKIILLLTFLLLITITANTLLSNFSENVSEIILQNITETIVNFSSATLAISEEDNGSGYSLGQLEGTPIGLIKKIPSAINVTFFRPYLWEAGKSMTLIAALESFVLFIFSVYIVFKARLAIFKYIFKDPNLLTFLLFSFIFAYIVGITTSNFGTLSRFKIPCMPFFIITLFIINNYYEQSIISKKTANNENDVNEILLP